jgi:hypothetical protein
VNNQTSLTGSNPVGSNVVVDFVGYGSANAFEGSAAATGPSGNSTAMFRKSGGFTDSNTNAADFVVLAAAPRNSSSPTNAPLTPIQQWRLQWFGTTLNSGAAADTAVASSDGMPNLLKYALGLDPLLPTNNPVAGDISAGFLRLTAPKNPAATDVTFNAEVTGKLTPAAWTTNGTTIDQNTATLFQAHANAPVNSGTNGFIRLYISQP